MCMLGRVVVVVVVVVGVKGITRQNLGHRRDDLPLRMVAHTLGMLWTTLLPKNIARPHQTLMIEKLPTA